MIGPKSGPITIEATGGRAIAIRADVSQSAEIDRLFTGAIQRFGRLDIAVANAGVELVGRAATEFNDEDFDRLFAVNANGTIFTMQRAAI